MVISRDFTDVYKLNEWSNIVYDNDSEDDTCAVKLISSKYPKLYPQIKKLETSKGVKVSDFINFCNFNKIGHCLYDEHGKKTHDKNNINGKIICVIYNNHIYPIYGGKLKRASTKDINIQLVDDSFSEVKKLLDKKILPGRIIISAIDRKMKIESSDINIVSYTFNNIRYICNPQYEDCKTILTKMGYEKYIYDNITLNDIPSLLEKILKVPDVSSFIPEMDNFKTAPLLYKTNSIIDYKKVVTEDKNKAYSSALYTLPYLYKFDFRTDNINIITGSIEIKDQYLYLVQPEDYTILIPCTKLYPGYHLNTCKKEGIKFTILEELEAQIIPNFYRQIIDLLYKYMPEKTFKSVMNIFIGKMERSYLSTYSYEHVGIYSDEDARTHEGFKIKIGDRNLLFKEVKKYQHVRNCLPIATQIKDISRMMIYNRIKKLGLTDSQIVQINTDSISFYGKLSDDLNKTNFMGWKASEFKELGDLQEVYDNDFKLMNIRSSNTNKRILHMRYAGSGKTTEIINELIPRLVKDKISYIVLTPTHTTLEEYKRKNINCDIIQRYILATDSIPEEQYIIIDEIGFMDRACHDLLYKFVKENKDIECFGDFNQLQPVDNCRFNQPHYLKYLFTDIDEEFVNYRNNFTVEYYNSLINSTDKDFLTAEVKKAFEKIPRRCAKDFMLSS